MIELSFEPYYYIPIFDKFCAFCVSEFKGFSYRIIPDENTKKSSGFLMPLSFKCMLLVFDLIKTY